MRFDLVTGSNWELYKGYVFVMLLRASASQGGGGEKKTFSNFSSGFAFAQNEPCLFNLLTRIRILIE